MTKSGATRSTIVRPISISLHANCPAHTTEPSTQPSCGNMFHTLNRSWRPMTAADYKLADEVMDCWTNFVKYGNPNGRVATDVDQANKPDSGNWHPFTLANPFVMTFNIK